MDERRILIVDDEASIRESLAEFLRDFDMTVDTAENGEDALQMVSRQTFDVVVADLRLPGIAGDAMIARAHQLRKNLRFLIHTGSIDYRLSNELLELGITREQVLLKPLSNLSILVDKIESLLQDAPI